jgi:HPt (histidine-containing phosphotransfer) domain-containing protein
MNMEQEIIISRLKAYVGDDLEQVKDIISLFLSTMPEHLEQLKKSIESKNVTKIKNIAHTIKPSLDILGFSDIKDVASNIVEMTKNGENDSEVIETSKQLIKHLENVIIKTKEMLDGINR